ncbi:PREDICTED: uncharacterized protein LOC108572611 [Habropoda laboriosa]|nr:PREDICTED: uncharacterized protein LOC108572611 [Habropoda laboriosa]
MRFAYTPDNGDFTISLYENNNRIFYRTLSLRSRSVFCLPILRFVKFCLTLSDTYFNQNNLHTCLNLETRIFFMTVLTLRFNCVEIGPNGINWAQMDYIASENMEETQQQIDEPAVYDAVDFEQLDLEIYANYTSVLTPEEEAEIGQLKLKLFDKIDDRVMFAE